MGSKAVEERYGRGYFHGETSGYPSQGYAAGHQDWTAWLDFLSLVKPSGTLIDLGCAYGYLVTQARERGYKAFGLDISGFALSQEPKVQPYLAQAHLQKLPVASGQADLITLFDVLEHLNEPLQCLSECTRILRPDGFLLGATPDPIFFQAQEETHVFERPPSFWIAALERLGFQIQFRFSVEPYNFQFLAAFANSPAARKLRVFQHDFFAEDQDFVRTEGALRAVPRAGWGALTDGGRSIENRAGEPPARPYIPAAVYLLNPRLEPLRLKIDFRLQNSPDFSSLQVRLNSYALAQVHLTSEQLDHHLELPEILLPSGGHHLFFELTPGGPQVRISDITISAQSGSAEDLTLGLPFDLYQRYRLAAEIQDHLGPTSVLDVGGYIGDQEGHLATSRDFLNASETVVTDVRQCDHPHHVPALAWEQPFADGSFDLVLSLDVLEHLEPARRLDFMKELDRLARHWILLGAPFASPEVERAERELGETVMATQQFLREHQEHGLPETSSIEHFFRNERGYAVYAFPNGYLPRWKKMQALTQHYFGFKDYGVIQSFNRLYNQYCYRCDQVEPAYRTLFLVCKRPPAAQQEAALAQLRSPDAYSCSMSEQRLFLEIHQRIATLQQEREKALQDVQFLMNERQKLIDLLRQELDRTPIWRLALRRLRKLF